VRAPLIILFVAVSLSAQSFDSVTIRPNRSANARGDFLAAGNHLTITNFTLRALIQWAYEVRNYQVSGGPLWLDFDKFDVEATSIVNLEPAKMKELLRPRLADRFGLVVHRETRPLKVYALLVDKHGPKLRAAQADDDPEGFRLRPGRNGLELSGHRASVAALAAVLTGILRRQVLDQTGIQGDFDFKLAWTPEGGTFDLSPGPDDPLLIDPLPTAANPAPFLPKGLVLADALSTQLGLKIESRKAPVEILLIDRVQKIPIQN
jgi:uncharacterized protein (TIGR03435 family)